VPGQVLASSDISTWMRPLAGYKTGTTSQSSNTVKAADPDLAVTFTTGGLWVIEMFLRFRGPASNTLAFAFTGTNLAGTFAVEFINGSGNLDLRQHPWSYTGMTAQTTGTLAANEQVLRLHGLVTASAGAFTLTWAQGTSSATATSIDAGSFLSAWRAN
jgi:hypothetical protein